jgi:hypothetical protein
MHPRGKTTLPHESSIHPQAKSCTSTSARTADDGARERVVLLDELHHAVGQLRLEGAQRARLVQRQKYLGGQREREGGRKREREEEEEEKEGEKKGRRRKKEKKRMCTPQSEQQVTSHTYTHILSLSFSSHSP